MATKKVKCNICGGTGKNAAYVNGKTITSPCGGCNGTGYQIVNSSSGESSTGSGCMLFFAVFLGVGITFFIVKYLI